ncbi:hypothetical protein KKC83_00075 [Patescibacteria group bacterium]|nr:hypothetical protein [Patescibacteria group bacterium]MCG2698042.1 hypothetical protein [Candidatus Parcubacteria bacterium]MBU4015151.1 hypothetical protein [Patescibacteria group bacterium]MBU4025937.1 hypothetical protein [Patescibacteria group bacterium]MBU4073119.1 hypothetical protein [Patescibacteria group bacterium]
MNDNTKGIKTIVSPAASALALVILKDSLKRGNSIKIPSLGIELKPYGKVVSIKEDG